MSAPLLIAAAPGRRFRPSASGGGASAVSQPEAARHLGRTRASWPCVLALALALGAGTPGPGAAEPVLVRSGEHDAFSRLTLALPDGAAWRLGRGPGGYLLHLDPPATEFETSAVFSRISRDRVADVRPLDGGTGLAIDIPCACHATAFTDSGGLLVIDIRPGPAPAGSPFEAGLTMAHPGGAGSVMPPPRPRNRYDWAESITLQHPQPPQTDTPNAQPATPHLAISGQGARDLLLRQVARATSQGLVESREPQVPGPPPPPTPDSAPAPDPAPPAAAGRDMPAIPALPSSATSPVRLNAETAIDRANRGRVGATPPEEAVACLPDGQFALTEWGGDDLSFVQISEKRRHLLGEFDTPEPEALAAIVRLYLHLGFGAEARATLAAFPGILSDAEILNALAVIIDDGAAPGPTPFHAMTGCNGPVALWASLAQDSLDPLEKVNTGAVLTAFSALPLHLRRHLGPPLTQRFLDAGSLPAAQAVRAAIERAPGHHGADLEMIAAELDLAEGRDAAALRRLADVARGNSVHAAVALARLAEIRLAAGDRLSDTTAQNLAARAVEHRGTELGNRLARLEVLGLAAAGDFDAGFAARDRQTRVDAKGDAALTEELFAILVKHASDTEFLTRSFAETAWRGGGFDHELRLEFGARMLALGFPAPARDALAPADIASADETLLHARAALAADDAPAALDLLAGQESAAAALLRGTAHSRLGDHRAALAAFRTAGTEAPLARAAWLAQDAQMIDSHGSELQRAVMGHRGEDAAPPPVADEPDPAAMGAGGDPLPPSDTGPGVRPVPDADPTAEPEMGMLTRSRAILERSRDTRALLDALMAAHDIDDGG